MDDQIDCRPDPLTINNDSNKINLNGKITKISTHY
jgi:hypothetical protein